MITLCSDFSDFYICDAAFMHILCLKSAFFGSALEEDIWVQREDGEICSVIARHGGRLYIASCGGDAEELAKFIKTIGFDEVFTEKSTADSLGLASVCEFNVLFKNAEGSTAPRDYIPSLKAIYDGLLLGSDSDISLPPFELFAPDLSHRLRHGSALAISDEFGAALAFRSPEGGIINGIAVEKARRFKGFGSRLLQDLLKGLNGDVLVCASEKNEHFYIKNGFILLGQAVIAR